jgi:hypothetical protein
MFKVKDFAEIFCCSYSSIHKKVREINPLFKKFKPNTRIHTYNVDQAKIIIRNIGIPPDNEFNRNLVAKFPELF